jgi:hypothetical protein
MAQSETLLLTLQKRLLHVLVYRSELRELYKWLPIAICSADRKYPLCVM